MFNSIEDRALSEHRGSALLMKKENGKYSILLPVEGTGENGSTPAQLDKTAIGNAQATSVEGRTEKAKEIVLNLIAMQRDMSVEQLASIAGVSVDQIKEWIEEK